MSSEQTVMIEAAGLRKVFTDFWGRPKTEALKELTLDVKQGEILGLLGPNGAGKSTFLKLVLGHLYPTAGILRVLGASPRDIDIKSRIGYLPENPAFWSTLTARETLRFFGRLHGLAKQEVDRRAEQLFSMTGIAHAAERCVGEFSHGMRKRLGLAQSLLNDPDLLILDEPTAGMDPLGCREVKDLILTLAQRGKTVVLTTHLLADVQDVCTEAAILYGGRLHARGPIKELLANPDESIIRTPALTPEEETAIRNVLNGKPIDISYAQSTLETFFMETVANAKTQESTSGAEAGSGVADYLKQLTTPEPSAPQQPIAPPVAKETLSELTKDTTPPPVPVENIDHSTLDSLTKK